MHFIFTNQSLALAHLFFEPLFGFLDPNDHIVAFLRQQSGPVRLFPEAFSTADNYQTMLGSSDANIDSVLLLDELACTCSNHGHENKVEFSSLRAINGKNLVIYILTCKSFSDGVFLSVVGSDHIDRVLGELHQFAALFRILHRGSFTGFELLQTEVFKLTDSFNFRHSEVRSSPELFFAIGDVNEQEGSV